MNDYINKIRIYLSFFNNRKFDFSPWEILSIQDSKNFSSYLYKKYPSQLVYPFIRNGDDFGCFVLEGKFKKKYIFIHDFASPGWETVDGNEKDNFGSFLESLIDEILFCEDASQEYKEEV